MAEIVKSNKHNHFISWGYAAVAAIIVAGCFTGWNIYKNKHTETVINNTKKDTKKAVIKHKEPKTKIIIVKKQVDKATLDTRPWAAVADFTVDKSVKTEISGSAVAIKLEQTFGNKYRLVTRSQVKKALHELRFQASDLANRGKAKQFGKMIGAEYLISGSIIQLGSKITIACQIFNVETGEIRQTAEISTSNVDDLNYIILREAADILVMSDAEKREYINAKIDYPKNIKMGKQAFSAKDYDKAIIYLKLALNAKRNDEIENLLILASEKAKAQHSYNERKAKYELAISHANKLLNEHKWDEAERVFRQARKIPGYEYDSKASNGIKKAHGGTNLILKKEEAVKELKLHLDSAGLLLENSKRLNKNNITAYRKCSAAIQLIVDFSNSKHYQYLSKRAKQYLTKFITRAEAYQRTLNPPLPPDLIIEKNIKHAPLSTLASGSRAAQNRQRNWAIKIGLPVEVKTKKVGIKLRLVPPGPFSMGSPYNESKRNKDENIHSVILLQPFYCGKFEITQQQWKLVMGTNPSYFKNYGKNTPVEQVSWNDCQEFLKKLCILEKVPQGTYRLLTEAQWEYACRAGTNSPFCYGKSLDSSMANFDGRHPYNALQEVFRKKPLPTGSFKANAWGLYDMHGNVWEWCSSWYNNYPSNNMKSGTERVIRGGSWNIPAKDCRSAARLKYWPTFRFNILGFRILRTISQKR
jgi:formylglycine-generating enzyme required for sulfatase activity